MVLIHNSSFAVVLLLGLLASGAVHTWGHVHCLLIRHVRGSVLGLVCAFVLLCFLGVWWFVFAVVPGSFLLIRPLFNEGFYLSKKKFLKNAGICFP